MYYFDPMYFVFALPGILFALWASFYTKSTFARYSQVRSGRGLTGAQAAATMLAEQGVRDVVIEPVRGMLTDHYDPSSKTLRLSEQVYSSSSLAAVGVACHEAGHAIVGELLDEANPVEKISIIPRGIGALGYTLNTPAEDRYLMTKNELLDTTCALLGGRAAEEIVFSEISTGAANDLQRATSIAQSMVKEYGMSETLGLVAHREERNQNQFMGMGSPDRPFSEETSRSIDSEVALIISQSYERAKVVLTEKREEMEKVVTVLFETEIMEGDQLRAILGKEPRHEEDTLSGAAAPAAEEAVNDGTSNKDHGAPSETTSAKSDPDAPGESPTTNESDVEDGPQSDDSATN